MDELRSEVDWYLNTLKVAKKIVARSPDGRIDDDGRSILDDKRRFAVSYVDDNGKRKTVKVPIDNVEILTEEENVKGFPQSTS